MISGKTDNCCMCYSTRVSQKDGSTFSVWITNYYHTRPSHTQSLRTSALEESTDLPPRLLQEGLLDLNDYVSKWAWQQTMMRLDSTSWTHRWLHSDLGCFGLVATIKMNYMITLLPDQFFEWRWFWNVLNKSWSISTWGHPGIMHWSLRFLTAKVHPCLWKCQGLNRGPGWRKSCLA